MKTKPCLRQLGFLGLYSILLMALTGCDSTSSRFVSVKLTASPTEVGVLEYSDITAEASPVTRGTAQAGGEARIYYKVEWSITRNESGAILIAASSTTDGQGKAGVTYRAGSKPGVDTIEVRLDDEVTVALNMVVRDKKPIMATLSANPERVEALAYSNLTADFRQDGQAVSLYPVNFVISQNQSGGALNAATPHTDANGQAKAVYQAGPIAGVDLVQVVGDGGETASVLLIAGPSGLTSFSIEASPKTVTPFEYSEITLTITQGNAPKAGYQTDITFVQNQSRATLMAINSVSDAQGRVRVLYQAGDESPGIDIVQIRGVQGGMAAVGIIVRSGDAVSLGLTATPAVLNVASYSNLQVQVRRGNQPVPNYRITFTVAHNASGGTLTALDALTDTQGNAKAVYLSGSRPGIDVVRVTDADGAAASVGIVVQE